jgi:hypothetical protein
MSILRNKDMTIFIVTQIFCKKMTIYLVIKGNVLYFKLLKIVKFLAWILTCE